MYKVKETFEYLVNDPNNFCSVHDALEMDTSMPCPCWDGSKVPVNEKGEEEYIPWGNSKVSITDIGNTVKIDKDTLLKLIKNSEKLSTLEEWGFKNIFKNRGESDYFVDDVIILDKNFSKIGDIVKGTNKTAPHDTLYVKIVK